MLIMFFFFFSTKFEGQKVSSFLDFNKKMKISSVNKFVSIS